MSAQFLVFGANHKTLPIKIREQLAVDLQKREQLLGFLLDNGHATEAVVLSTCNRFEIYAASSNGSGNGLRNFIARFLEVDAEILEKDAYFLRGGQAIGHLLKVTSSLDSLVVGEPQILSQVKEAYHQAKKLGATGSRLNFIFQKALKTAKYIRTRTGIAHNRVSISSIAAELIKNAFPELADKVVLIIGSGKMGKISIEHLVEAGVGRVLIANRTLQKAQELAGLFNGEVIPLENLETYLPEVDIVVGCATAPSAILHREKHSEAVKRRNGKPLFIVDLGVPRNVDPELGSMKNIQLYNIDQLQEIAASNTKTRQQEVQAAEEIIEEETAKLLQQVERRRHHAVISGLVENFQIIGHRELQKLADKLPELSEKQIEEIERTTRRIIGKVLHRPLSQLKKPELKDRREEIFGILKALFLDNEE
jgi:glutamyl-tRNA reductase